MSRVGGSLRYPLLLTTILLIAGCSYLPGKGGLFGNKETVAVDNTPKEPQIATRGNQLHEPQVVQELTPPKPRWKPDQIPVQPRIDNNLGELEPVEKISEENIKQAPEVAELLGMSFLQVKEKLGQPVWIRDVYPARVWGYDIESCSLQIFFYPKLDQAGDYRVLAYESGINGDKSAESLGQLNGGQNSSADSAIINPGKISEADQKLVQACFSKILSGSEASKEVLSDNSLPDS